MALYVAVKRNKDCVEKVVWDGGSHKLQSYEAQHMSWYQSQDTDCCVSLVLAEQSYAAIKTDGQDKTDVYVAILACLGGRVRLDLDLDAKCS